MLSKHWIFVSSYLSLVLIFWYLLCLLLSLYVSTGLAAQLPPSMHMKCRNRCTYEAQKRKMS